MIQNTIIEGFRHPFSKSKLLTFLRNLEFSCICVNQKNYRCNLKQTIQQSQSRDQVSSVVSFTQP